MGQKKLEEYEWACRPRAHFLSLFRRRTPVTLLLQSSPEGDPISTNLSGIVKQLTKERDQLHQQLFRLNAALDAFAEVYRGNSGIKARQKISAKGRARIAAAQRARWAKVKGDKATAATVKRMMSVSARRKIAAAQRARWAKAKQEKKAA